MLGRMADALPESRGPRAEEWARRRMAACVNTRENYSAVNGEDASICSNMHGLRDNHDERSKVRKTGVMR